MVGVPNVRLAERAQEKEALRKRYEEAKVAAEARGVKDRLAEFERAVSMAGAVINISIDNADSLLANDKTLYSNYRLQVDGEVRMVAELENDVKRTAVECSFFGSTAKDIRYAALSLDGVGLRSYGEISLRLKEIAVETRASLLECNTYTFVKRHPFWAGSMPEAGYRATWQGKAELAVAKCGAMIERQTTQAAFARLVLRSSGSREDDEFIEIHIHGKISLQAFEAAVLPKAGGTPTKDQKLNVIRDRLDKLGIRCTSI